MVFRARGIRLLACCILGIELHVAKCASFLGSILLKHIKLIYNTYINRTLVYRSVVFERVREIHNYTKLSPSSWHMQIVFKFLVLHNNFCFTVCPCSNKVWCTNVLLPTFNRILVLLVAFFGPHWFVDGAEDYATWEQT